MKKKILKFLIDKAKRSKLIQNLFEQPIDLNTFPVAGNFTDSYGKTYKLFNGYRTKIKPGWEGVFRQKTTSFDKSPARIDLIKANGLIAYEKIEPILKLYLPDLTKAEILEIGCSAGGTTFAFANQNIGRITGTEFSGYKIESLDNKEIEKDDLIEVNANLKELRDLVKERFNPVSPVRFCDDDICNTKLEHDQFDLICSWDVLEHIHDPKEAFVNIYKILKTGGYAIQEYNPFFSLSGGHSACTIDFPWGHVLLNATDFERFNNDIQPDRKDVSMAFYRNGINRMTIRDLKTYISESGLELVSIVPYPKEQHLRMLDHEVLKTAKRNYPTLELDDLITPKIIVIVKKA